MVDGFDGSTTFSLLKSSLEVAVSLWIPLVRENIDEEIKHVGELSQIVAEKGDLILFRSKRKGESAAAFNALAKGIAILSFAPGGVTVFGMHFETDAERWSDGR